MKIRWQKPVHKVGDMFDKQKQFYVVQRVGDLEVEKEYDKGIVEITVDWCYSVIVIDKDGSGYYHTQVYEKDLDRLEKMQWKESI